MILVENVREKNLSFTRKLEVRMKLELVQFTGEIGVKKIRIKVDPHKGEGEISFEVKLG